MLKLFNITSNINRDWFSMVWESTICRIHETLDIIKLYKWFWYVFAEKYVTLIYVGDPWLRNYCSPENINIIWFMKI